MTSTETTECSLISPVRAISARGLALALAMFVALAALGGADARQGAATPPQPPHQPPRRRAGSAPGAQRIIQHIVVRGTQRVEPATVLTYVVVREGDTYDPADVDTALKALFATGLFSDVKINFDGTAR